MGSLDGLNEVVNVEYLEQSISYYKCHVFLAIMIIIFVMKIQYIDCLIVRIVSHITEINTKDYLLCLTY